MAPSLVNEEFEKVENSPKLELKINLTDTELVLAEDLTSPSSNAIILKSTAVMHYQPSHEGRPLVCNLQVSYCFASRFNSFSKSYQVIYTLFNCMCLYFRSYRNDSP